jgi:hypothetical protein
LRGGLGECAGDTKDECDQCKAGGSNYGHAYLRWVMGCDWFSR